MKIPFLRVEDICISIKKDWQITDQDYITQVFFLIEKEIREQLQNTDQLTFETTAAASEFDKMLINLKRDFTVRLVKIDADPILCLKKVKIRDVQNHIPVSDEMVKEINQLSLQKHYDFDLIITNNNTCDQELLDKWEKLNLY